MREKKSLIMISLIVTLLVSTVFTIVPFSAADSTATLSAPIIVDASLTAGSSFHVNVTVADVAAMWGYEFVLGYDTSILTATSYSNYDPFVFPWPSGINDAAGTVAVSYSMMPGELVGFSTVDPKPIAGIDFTVDAEGESLLDLYNTKLTDIYGDDILYDTEDGYFSSTGVEAHNIAVTGVTANVTPPTTVIPGETVGINVTVMNKGFETETFDVTVKYDDIPIETKPVINLAFGISEILSFSWDTTIVSPGFVYTITAVAGPVDGETSTGDNTFIDGDVWLGRRDVGVANVTRASPTNVTIPSGVVLNVTRGELVYINVTAVNEGDFTETFNITAIRTGNIDIDTKPVTSLDAGANVTLTFKWDTTGVDIPAGQTNVTTRIKAVADKVPGETNETNNEFIDGNVTVMKPLGAPSASFTYSPSFPITGKTVTFTSTSTDPDGTIVNWDWDFGDETPHGTGETTTHNYTKAGGYTVTLNVTDNDGLTDTATKYLSVRAHDIAVTNVTASSTEVVVGESVTISVTVENQGSFKETDFNVTVKYDSNIIDTPQTVPSLDWEENDKAELTFTWNTTGVAAGDYVISAETSVVPDEFNITNNEMAFDGTVTILWPPVASFTYSPAEPIVGDTVTFTSTSTDEEPGYIVDWDWDFGDETPHVTGETTTHNYTKAGAHTVTLNVTDNDGLTDTATESIIIGKLGSSISISADPTTITVGDTTTITGSITPERAGVAVTIWYRLSGEETWENLTTVETDENSQYSYEWTPTTAGDYEVRATWEGDATHMGDESDPQPVKVEKAAENTLLYAVIVAAIVIVAATVLIYFLKVRKPKQT